MSDFTWGEVLQRLESMVLRGEKVPLQGFIRVPALPVLLLSAMLRLTLVRAMSVMICFCSI